MNNIIDNGETQIGRVQDIIKAYRLEIKYQIENDDLDLEEQIYNIRLIIDLIEDLLKEFSETIIEVKYNPMGCYEYVKYEKEEEIK